MNRVYTQIAQGQAWLQRHQGYCPQFICVLGFTETGLIPGISAAGATPEARRRTAIADAEFLERGPQADPAYPLPPLAAGASPALITRAVVANQGIPIRLFNAGLPETPAFAGIHLAGQPARCLSTGEALPTKVAGQLLQQGLLWGTKLGRSMGQSYLVIGECVVGGTTTALAVLTGLGYAATGKVNSSHLVCNHSQKWQLVQQGLAAAQYPAHPLTLAAAVGDPMQIVVAGMALAASRTCGVLLAGGTQMLAVYALARAIATTQSLAWQPEQIIVGTTRWVVEDTTGDTVGLAELIGDVPLIASHMNFAPSRYPQLRAYEQGFVKEGVGAGGCGVAAALYQGWDATRTLTAVEALMAQLAAIQQVG